jgi:hypothetical protein
MLTHGPATTVQLPTVQLDASRHLFDIWDQNLSFRSV